jgi:hypothetical protein
MVLYKFYGFCSDMKFKMAATAGLSLTLDGIKKQKLCRGPSNDNSCAVWFQLSKWFQRRSVLKHFSQNGPLQTLRFLFRYEIQNGGYGRT